ncbi:MAG: hypothetical protein Q8R70_07730, partial [Methanoregula sp.]|nr:hypothetical protein [Methanoregula sp.]
MPSFSGKLIIVSFVQKVFKKNIGMTFSGGSNAPGKEFSRLFVMKILKTSDDRFVKWIISLECKIFI